MRAALLPALLSGLLSVLAGGTGLAQSVAPPPPRYQTPAQIQAATGAAGYLTADQVSAMLTARGYATPAQISSMTAGAGYQTASQVSAMLAAGGFQTSGQVAAMLTAGNFATAEQVAAAISAARAVLPGTYTVAELRTRIPAAANVAKYAFVTDLGGGADMVISDGSSWKRIRRGSIVPIPASSQVVDPLKTGSVLMLPSSVLGSAVQISVAVENLYLGCEITVVNPGTLGALGSIGIGIVGSSTAAYLPLLGQKWVDLVFDGTRLVVVRTGGLAG